MNSNRTELLAAWVVAIALIGAMSAHALLPKAPPRVGPGVTNIQQRPGLAGRDLAARAVDTGLPLNESTLAYPLPDGEVSPPI